MKSSLLLSCFFHNRHSEEDVDHVDVHSKEPGIMRSLSLGTRPRSVLHPHHPPPSSPPPPRSPTASHSHHNIIGPELKERCRSFITRNKSHHHSSRHHPGHRHSGDFRYDALSYSLNFEEPGMQDDSLADDFVQRSFSARLQASSRRMPPTTSPKKASSTEITALKCQTLISGGVRGTLPWMAPELLNGSSSLVSEKVDVFSFGIVMWELLTGEEPYADFHYGVIIGGIVSNTLRPPIPDSCDSDLRSLMERCWSSEPSERPSFTEIVNNLRSMATKIPPKAQFLQQQLPSKQYQAQK